MFEDFTLLEDGKNAFPYILDKINSAQREIIINMFIWRDDEIGNLIAKAILNAADRGVKVAISKDRYGVVLEACEECKKSFFHRRLTLSDKAKALGLLVSYPKKNRYAPYKADSEELYRTILRHPNIKIDADRYKEDHSKYYIIDDCLILGGINIEDKENGKDLQGRVYQDYMISLNGQKYVDSFLDKLENDITRDPSCFFGINMKGENRRFEMHDLYLDMIRSAKTELTITMAYFSPLQEFTEAIADAHRRGVHVTIMIPKTSNFQDDANKKAVRKLMAMTDNGIELYFSPKMVHTKMVINDDTISFGSTNITKKAFAQLNELNIFLHNGDSPLIQAMRASIDHNYQCAVKISDYRAVRYNPVKAYLESFLV